MHFARERYLYFLPCKMQQKRTTKLFLLTTWRMALTTKRAIFCSFLNVIFLEKNVICTCCLAKCIRKGKQILLTTWRMALTTKMHQRRTTKLFLLTTWRMALTTKRAILCSFLNVIFLEKNVIFHLYFLTCQMHQKRRTKLFLLTTWRMALTTKRATFGSILNVIFLKINVICTFCLAKCIRKGKKKSFWLHEEWLSPQKDNFFVPFWTSSF